MRDGGELFLPRAAEAVVPVEKLRDYSLNPDHDTGRHKARVFASALGIEQADWKFLRDQILSQIAASLVSAIRPKSPYGMEYEVRVEIDGRNGATARVITGWLVPESGPPWLTTAYVETSRRG